MLFTDPLHPQKERLMAPVTPGYRSSATCPSYPRPPSSCRRTNPQAGTKKGTFGDGERVETIQRTVAEFVRRCTVCKVAGGCVCGQINMIYFSFSVFEPSLATKKHAHLSYYCMSLNGTLTHLTVNSICKILDLQS